MREYFILVKMFFSSFFRRNPNAKKGSIANIVAFSIIAAVFGIILAVTFGMYGGYIRDAGFLAETVAVIFSLSFVYLLFFGTSTVLTYVFYEPEYDFLLSLPASPSKLFISKLTIVYIEESWISMGITLLSGIPLGISSGQGFVYYLLIVLGSVLVPAMTLFLSSLAALPIKAVSSYFKNRGLVGTILMISFFAIFFIVYFVIEMNIMQAVETTELDGMIDALKTNAVAVATVFYPLYSLGRLATGTLGITLSAPLSAAIDLSIFFGSFALLLAAVTILSKAIFLRAIRLHGSRSGGKTAIGTYVENSAVKALFKKEWKELIGNSSFAFQCLTGVVISPVFAIMFPFILSSGYASEPAEFDQFFSTITFLSVIMMIHMFSSGANITAGTAITREGKTFFFTKTLPVPAEAFIRAKRKLSILIQVVQIIISMVILAVIIPIIYPVDIFSYIILITMPTAMMILSGIVSTNLDLMHDIKRPKLFWTNPKEAVKNNTSVILPMLAGFGVAILCFIIPLSMNMMLGNIGLIIAYSLLIGLGVLFVYLSDKRLYTKGAELFDAISI